MCNGQICCIPFGYTFHWLHTIYNPAPLISTPLIFRHFAWAFRILGTVGINTLSYGIYGLLFDIVLCSYVLVIFTLIICKWLLFAFWLKCTRWIVCIMMSFICLWMLLIFALIFCKHYFCLQIKCNHSIGFQSKKCHIILI